MQRIIKSCLEYLFAIFCLILLSPLFILIPIIIGSTLSGPVFLKEYILGIHGKTIYIYKFRTKRRLLIERLPALINILKGELSLIGPGIYKPYVLEAYPHQLQAILTVKPGLINLSEQKLDITYRIETDLNYLADWSLWTDIQVLWRFLLSFMIGTGI
jgi:lipopolysaccharide/colanic/teichoic acid biosynthesis glycosyltransferase